MSAVAEKTLITPEEFLRMPDQKDFELIDGELVSRYGDPSESRVSILSSWVGGQIFHRMQSFCEGEQLGWCFPGDGGFQCFPDRPKTVRKPDVSFVKADRMSWEQITDGWLRIVPDLIVEVVSPNDLAYDLDEKVDMFLRVGVPLIWVVNPQIRMIRVIRSNGSGELLRDRDVLSGEAILPGFLCSVSSLFPPHEQLPPVHNTTDHQKKV